MAVYLALGANIGDRESNIRLALRLLEPQAHVEAVGALYESTPQPPAPPPDFLNTACRVSTLLDPEALLEFVKRVESDIGRRPGPLWGPRPIDIDIVLYDDRIMDTADLTIPHTQLLQRNFVLQPLLDMGDDLVHPVTGEQISKALERLGHEGLSVYLPLGWY